MLQFHRTHFFLALLFSLPLALNAQDTQIRGFVDSQFGKVWSDTLRDQSKSRGFQVGQFDLYISSQINDRVSFLGETVFEWSPEKNDWSLDVERMIIRYSVKDYLNISTGKFFTPIGYWNQTYNHGALIQPTINRPTIIRFEDEQGFLPVHLVGLQFSGDGIGSKNFGYNFFLTNGQSQGNTGGSFDYNSNAISGSISFEPIEDFKLSLSAYSNRVPKGSFTYQGVKLNEDSRYTLLNGAVSYFGSSLPIEFVAEYFNINNKLLSSHTANAMYSYLGFPVNKKIIPYVLYNKVMFQSGEEYFIKNDIEEVSIGTRFVLSPKVVWKLEYTTNHSELSKNSSMVQTQFAIGF